MKMIYRPDVSDAAGRRDDDRGDLGNDGLHPRPGAIDAGLLPVHFDDQAIADRFVRASYAVILVPVWIQLALAIVFGAIAERAAVSHPKDPLGGRKRSEAARSASGC